MHRFLMSTVLKMLMQISINAVEVSNLYEVNRVLSVLQVLQLAAPHLQIIEFLLQLLEQLLSSPLSFLLPLLQLLDQPGMLSLDGAYQHAADLSAALYFPLCDFLVIETFNELI